MEDGWNGTVKNEKADMGVYVWMVTGLTKDGQQIIRKGNVTLLR